MKETEKLHIIYSWPVIVFALCFFWPIGVFLLIKRISRDKKTALKVDKIVTFVSVVFYIGAFTGIIACTSDGFEPQDIMMILFFGIGGFALQRLAKNMKKEAASIKQYLAIIVNGNVRQLDKIALTTGKSYDAVKADIQKMIQKEFLKNAYIDENLREIVLSSNTMAVNTTLDHDDSASIQNHAATRTVTCSCCGANNTISGTSGECEYCGSPIQ